MSPRFSGWLGVVVWCSLATTKAHAVEGQTLCGFEDGFGGGAYFSSYAPAAMYSFDPDGAGPAGELLALGSFATSYPKISGLSLLPPTIWDGENWTSPGGGINGYVGAIVFGDEDGFGPLPSALFVGGQFASAGGVPAQNIARWDGQNWSAVGGGIQSKGNGGVGSFCFFDPDEAGPQPKRLFVGGVFDSAGGVPAKNIAMWDGDGWHAIGAIDGNDAAVGSMVSFDVDGNGPEAPALAVAGKFTSAGGLAVSSLAFWRNGEWTAPAIPLAWSAGDPPQLQEACVFDPDGDGPETPRLAVRPLAGKLMTAGPYEVDLGRIALWTGNEWLATPNPPVLGYNNGGMTVFDPDEGGPHPPMLAIAGKFTAGPGKQGTLALWNNGPWIVKGTGNYQTQFPQETVRLVVSRVGRGANEPPALIAASKPWSVGLGEIIRWNGDAWGVLGNGLGYVPEALAEYDADGEGGESSVLVASGAFKVAGSAEAGGIATWDGKTWTRIVDDLALRASALAVGAFDPNSRNRLLACAFGSTVSDTRTIRAWDGASWTTLGADPAFNAHVECLTVFDEDGPGPSPPMLYAGGLFTLITGPTEVPAHRVARWDGLKWSPVGTGLGPAEIQYPEESVRRLVEFDPDGDGPAAPLLAAGGSFKSAGTVEVNGVAFWDGKVWLPGAPPEVDHNVSAMCVFDFDGPGGEPAELVLGGSIFAPSLGKTSYIGRWSNGVWIPMNNGLGGYGAVRDLAAFDSDGNGPNAPELYAGGFFKPLGSAGGLGFVRWTGDVWAAVGDTDTEGEPYVTCFAPVYGAADGLPALYLGGYFHSVHGISSQYIAKWSCPNAATNRTAK